MYSRFEMSCSDIIWLASYPRSGNTLVRTILWHCFGLRSASVYPNDLGGNKILENYVGHIEHGPQMYAQLRKEGISLVKTHEHARDTNPAIYIIRDGRAACVSLWRFSSKGMPLETVIEGRHIFGTWADHVQSWDPMNRPNTLLLKYEDLMTAFSESLIKISIFLNKEIVNNNIPDRNKIAGIDGKWVCAKSNWRTDLFGRDLKLFNDINKEVLKAYGYI